jgi:hypothetical protein
MQRSLSNNIHGADGQCKTAVWSCSLSYFMDSRAKMVMLRGGLAERAFQFVSCTGIFKLSIPFQF